MTRALAALVLILAGHGQARVPIVEGDTVQLSFGGYLRAFGGYSTSPTDSWLHTSVARAELRFGAADVIAIAVHSRFQWTVGPLPGAGVGVSGAPKRTVDLQSALIDEDENTLTHDLDRAVVRLFLGPADLSLGRQAVTWGTASVFPVADIWSAFSPFDLDTSQKRGVDAIRAVIGASDTVEIDVIAADRGSLEDLSGGVRVTFYQPFGDLYAACAKTFQNVAVMAGVSGDAGPVKLRGEVVGLYDLEAAELLLPRAVVGVDWFAGGDLTVGAEGYFNGPGLDVDNGAFLPGRWYAAVYGSWKPHPLVSLTLSPLTSLTDPAALIAWNAQVSVITDLDVSLGAFHSVGGFGQLVYLQLAAFL